MKWQWKIGRFLGIDVYIHATFLLLIGWVGIAHWLDQRSWNAVIWGIAFILALFLFVVMHEYGHALTARHFGIRTRDITLYPIGGVARLERMPDNPLEELWVALAGPAVNVVAAILLFGWLLLTNTFEPITNLTISRGSFIERLAVVNLALVVFNLLPAFPMDGGRVLRALLAMNMDYVRATQIAASIGQGMALLFGLAGLLGNPTLLFIALFVWIGASQEANLVQLRNAISGIPVAQAMLTDFHHLSPNDTLQRMADLILAGYQHDFPVIENDRLIGIVTRDDFLSALTRGGPTVLVTTIMRSNLPEVDSHEMIENALLRMQEESLPILPVTHAGRLVGLITNENIAEYFMIRNALRAARGMAAQLPLLLFLLK